MTRLGIKPKSTAPEADALTTRPSELYFFISRPTVSKKSHCTNEKMILEQIQQKIEKHIIDVSNFKLQLNTPLTSLDIDICHFLPSKKGKNPIIMKFVRRTVRNEVFNNKLKLKFLDSNSRLAITESLTERRLKLVDEARHVFDFRNVWIMKGFVYCRFQGQRHYIDDFSDISRIRLGPTKQV